MFSARFSPPARAFFNLYYFKVVPWLGSHLVSGQTISNGFPAYTWLAESLKTFPPRHEIAQMFRDAGLTAVEVKPVGFGAATIYSGIKTSADYDFEAAARRSPLAALVHLRAFAAKVGALVMRLKK